MEFGLSALGNDVGPGSDFDFVSSGRGGIDGLGDAGIIWGSAIAFVVAGAKTDAAVRARGGSWP